MDSTQQMEKDMKKKEATEKWVKANQIFLESNVNLDSMDNKVLNEMLERIFIQAGYIFTQVPGRKPIHMTSKENQFGELLSTMVNTFKANLRNKNKENKKPLNTFDDRSVNNKTLIRGTDSSVVSSVTIKTTPYAIKEVFMTDEMKRLKIQKEIDILKKLTGKKHIIQLIDSKLVHNKITLVMELGSIDLRGVVRI